MPIGAWTATSTWAPARTVQVWPNETLGWQRAKKVTVWNGVSWVLSWVHPVTNAGLSLSKSGVAVNEAYSVTLTAPDGFPQGAAVTFRRTGYTSPVVNPAEGGTTATLTGATNATSGSYAWYADVTTKGGNTSFGPVTQTVAIVSTSVTLTAPAWALSESQSGSGGWASIAQAPFSITLSTPASVSTLSLQLSYSGGAWTEYQSWANPAATSNHSITFNTTGAWRARAVATQVDSSVVYSAEKAITCYKKSLALTASPTSPVVGDTITYQASHSGDALGSTFGSHQYYRASNPVWTNYPTTPVNPLRWTPGGADDIYWRWLENYSDGSTIISNNVHSVVTDNVVRTDDGSYGGVAGGTGLVNAMRAARSANKPLWVYGTWSLALDEIWIPDGVTVVCQPGVKFNHSPVARFKNAAAWPASNMPNSCGGYSGGSFSWTGGDFDGGGDGIFTLSHSPGFTITGARFWNYCSGSEDGHAIECNSSGGNDLGGAGYTVQITNNSFLGTTGQRTNGNDEPMHYDWAWQGSGCGGAEDHSMCQNVRIAGNTFHRASEGWGGYYNGGFALCAIGGHRMGSGSYSNMGNAGIANPSNGEPSQRHNSFLIEGNAIHAAVGASAGVSPNKGAIALWNLRDVVVRNNNFYSCNDALLVSGWDATQNLNSAACNISISGNAHNGVAKGISMPASNTTGG